MTSFRRSEARWHGPIGWPRAEKPIATRIMALNVTPHPPYGGALVSHSVLSCSEARNDLKHRMGEFTEVELGCLHVVNTALQRTLALAELREQVRGMGGGIDRDSDERLPLRLCLHSQGYDAWGFAQCVWSSVRLKITLRCKYLGKSERRRQTSSGR